MAAQQTHQLVPEDRADNLFEPVPGDQGAHGIFDAEAKERSVQAALSMHRGAAAGRRR